MLNSIYYTANTGYYEWCTFDSLGIGCFDQIIENGILRHSEFLSVALLEILFFVVNIHTGIGEVALKLYICDRIFLFKIRKNAKNPKKCKMILKMRY